MRISKYTLNLLSPIVRDNTSWAGVLRALGLKLTGGNYRNIQGHVRHHNIDTAHFTGQGWANGATSLTDRRIATNVIRNRHTVDTALIENYPGKLNSNTMRRLLLSTGVAYTCINGHDSKWMDKPLTLHVDHINGISNDNRAENLRFLCPNCHQQTSTWGNNK